MSAEQIAQKMKEKQDSIKDYSATMVVSSSFSGKEEMVKAKMMNKMPDKSRIEYLEPAEMAGRVMVNDGKTIWSYDPEKNEVTRMDMPEIATPPEQDYTQFIKELLNQTDISYQGTEKFEGRSVYNIKASPRDSSMLMGMRYNMLVDSENWMPLKIEVFDKNDKLMTSIEYRDIKFNTGISDSEFEFKVPEGAKVVTRELPAPPKQMTLEEARKEVNFTVLTPSYLPEGFTFNSSTVFKFEKMETVSLQYKKGSQILSLSESLKDESNPSPDMGEFERVSINGAQGKLISGFGETKILIWNNGKLELVLSSQLSKEEMIKVAGSIK
ncbi:MAG: outer membrane lipoprotein-sorting protein [Candidatus Methanoperedens sp.]